jgi:hypothetical protein
MLAGSWSGNVAWPRSEGPSPSVVSGGTTPPAAHDVNLTTADAPSGSSSYVTAQEAPIPPPTAPLVVSLFSGAEPSGIMAGHLMAPRAPPGGWGMVEVNFTTTVTGELYDTDYNVWLGGVLVLFGTLPEYGTATVLKDITEYESVLSGNVSWELRHPHDCVSTCTFTSALSLRFYPAAGFAPAEPNAVVQVWNYSTLEPGRESATATVTVPADTAQAYLEVYPYGYGADEFWYADEPQFRSVNISVGGTPVAYVQPFPYINTGGIDLFAWRPIAADLTLDDRPYVLDLDAALGIVDGTRTWTVTIAPTVTSGSYWHVSADLLLYASSKVRGATLTGYGWTNFAVSTYATPACVDYVSALCYFNQSAAASYHYASSLNGTATSYASSSSLSFVNDQLITPVWENITGDEVSSTTVTTTVGHASSSSTTTTSFPLGLQTGTFLTVTGTDSYNCSTTSTFQPCPEGLYISLLNNLSQSYNQTVATPSGLVSYLNETTLVPLSNFTANLLFIAPTAAEITTVAFNDAATTQVYTQDNAPSDPFFVDTATVAGSDYVDNATVATTSNDAEAIDLDTAVRAPTLALFLAEAGSLEGAIDQFSAEVASLEGSSGAGPMAAPLLEQTASVGQEVDADWAALNVSGITNATVGAEFAGELEQVAALEASLQRLESTSPGVAPATVAELLAASTVGAAMTTLALLRRGRRPTS